MDSLPETEAGQGSTSFIKVDILSCNSQLQSEAGRDVSLFRTSDACMSHKWCEDAKKLSIQRVGSTAEGPFRTTVRRNPYDCAPTEGETTPNSSCRRGGVLSSEGRPGGGARSSYYGSAYSSWSSADGASSAGANAIHEPETTEASTGAAVDRRESAFVFKAGEYSTGSVHPTRWDSSFPFMYSRRATAAALTDCWAFTSREWCSLGRQGCDVPSSCSSESLKSAYTFGQEDTRDAVPGTRSYYGSGGRFGDR